MPGLLFSNNWGRVGGRGERGRVEKLQLQAVLMEKKTKHGIHLRMEELASRGFH